MTFTTRDASRISTAKPEMRPLIYIGPPGSTATESPALPLQSSARSSGRVRWQITTLPSSASSISYSPSGNASALVSTPEAGGLLREIEKPEMQAAAVQFWTSLHEAQARSKAKERHEHTRPTLAGP